MSPNSVKASSLYSEAKMVDSTRVKFDVPIGTWGHTEVEVEYPWHRDLDSIILPLLEAAHEAQAERQRKHRSDNSQNPHKSHSKSRRTSAKTDRADRPESVVPARPNEDIKLFLKGSESAKDVDMKRGDTFQNVLEQYARQAEKDAERLELFYKGRHAGRGMTPDSGSRMVRNCKSMSSFSSSSVHSQSTAQGKQRARTGTIYVANGIEEMITSVPPQSRQPFRTSDSSLNSDRAKQLDIESAFEDIPPPSESIYAQPGPSRRISHYRTRSIASDKALTILGIEDFPVSESPGPRSRVSFSHQDHDKESTTLLSPLILSGRSFDNTSLSPLGSNPPNGLFPIPVSDVQRSPCRQRRQSTQSSEKARRILGFDQPDRRPDTQAGPPFDSIDAGHPPSSCNPERYAEHDNKHDPTRSIAAQSSAYRPKLKSAINGPSTAYLFQTPDLRPRDSWMPPCVAPDRVTVLQAAAADKRASVIASAISRPSENIQYEVGREKANLCRRCPRMSGFLQSAAEAVR